VTDSAFDKILLTFFRVTMAWTFLYAASHQLFDPSFSAAGFLGQTKTFHGFFAWFASPAMLPVTNVLVEWGHFLIGASLLCGLLVRISAPAGALLMVTYYFAHMDFPYIENKLNFIVDYHMVYAAVLVVLMVKHAGRVWGLDGILAKLPIGRAHPRLVELLG
jgi:thiosulfate dehydrogenase [quinone] large subunit